RRPWRTPRWSPAVAKVPGTFKSQPGVLRRYDDRGPFKPVADMLESQGARGVEFWQAGECRVILAREPVGTSGELYRWHLSISHPSRYPTWDEIKDVRYRLPSLANVGMMVQMLPSMEAIRGQWTNIHDN